MADNNNNTKSKTKNPKPDLPHNLEAERKVLGSMLLDREVVPEVSQHLEAVDFFQPAHQEIYEVLVDLYNENKPIDLTFVTEELQKKEKLDDVGGFVYLAQLENSVLSTSAGPDNAFLVRDKSILRRLILASQTIQREAYEESRAIQDIIESAESEIYNVNRENRAGGFRAIKDVMEDTIGEILHLYETKEPKSGLRTHLLDLDRIIGGFEPSALVILAARPSMGKTAIALNIVRNVAIKENRPVAFFSLEMGADQLNMRLLCSEARVPSHKVQRGKISEEEWEKLRTTASRLMESHILIDDTPALSIMQVRSRSRRIQAKYKNLGMIVVDYLQLMTGSTSNRDQSRQQEVAEISRGLKALAKELNVPVMALSQLSRGIEQRSGKDKAAEPQLSDLRESGSIEQDADVVMFVHRERKEAQRDDAGNVADRSEPIDANVIVGKNRNGPIGRAEMYFIPEFTLFVDKLKS